MSTVHGHATLHFIELPLADVLVAIGLVLLLLLVVVGAVVRRRKSR